MKESKKYYIAYLERELGENRNYFRGIREIEDKSNERTLTSRRGVSAKTKSYSKDIRKKLSKAIWNHLIGNFSLARKGVSQGTLTKKAANKEIVLKLADLYAKYTGEPPAYTNSEAGNPFVRICRVCSIIANEYYGDILNDCGINLSSHRTIKAAIKEWRTDNRNFLQLYKLSCKSK